MEWFSFAGWDSDAFRQTLALGTWRTQKDDHKPASARADVDAKVRDFVASCPAAQLERCAPTQLR